MAPSDWSVISNEKETKIDSAEKTRTANLLAGVSKTFKLDIDVSNFKLTSFARSKRFSTYLYAFVAGPYKFVESNKPNLVPMRIYMRHSIVEDIKPETLQEMFMITQQGMMFYKELFGTPYQFSKYDQVFVPEFNAGAMENVGCVTYKEDYLKRGSKLSLGDRLHLANTNLHELAHQWFGNLVTMRWWNDLWLNESFATYMAYLGLSKIPKLNHFKDEVWIDFIKSKFEGVRADELKTTHPVLNSVKSVDQAESVFNGISYGKGASFLKLMYKVLGHETFKNGLHEYFEKFAW